MSDTIPEVEPQDVFDDWGDALDALVECELANLRLDDQDILQGGLDFETIVGDLVVRKWSVIQDLIPEELKNDQALCRAFVLQGIDQDAWRLKLTTREQQATLLAPDSGAATQLDPEEVFYRLLDLAVNLPVREKDKSIPVTYPYRDFVQQYDHDHLYNIVKAGIRDDVWKALIEDGGAEDLAVLDAWDADEELPNAPGWYLIVLTKRDGTIAGWYRKYVGQAGPTGNGLRGRGREHKSCARTGNSRQLVYRVWRGMDTSWDRRFDHLDELPCKAKFIHLGTDLSGLVDTDQGKFLSIGEMFLGLMLTALQIPDLQEWLPPSAAISSEPRGLMVALPLYQSYSFAARTGFSKLFKSGDPEVVAYFTEVCRKNAAIARSHRWDKAGNMENLRNTLRSKDSFANRFRGPLTSDPKTVQLRCPKCQTVTDDDKPSFVRESGKYVVRPRRCEGCPKPVAANAKRETTPRVPMKPTDPNLPWINENSVYRQARNQAKRARGGRT